MAQPQGQDFDSLLNELLIDIDGDGVPDMAVPAMTNRERGRIQRRAMAGREPSAIDQARLNADMPRLEENSQRLAGTVAELTGLPAMGRGVARVGRGFDEGSPLQMAAGVGEAAFGALPIASQVRAAGPVLNSLMGTAPRSMATIGAAALPIGMADVGDAQAAKLTRQQQREQEIERLRQEREVAAERQRALDQAAAEKQRQMDQIEIDRQRQAEDLARQQEQERLAREANARPWRERNPEMAAALPAFGYALAAGVPAVGAMLRNVGSHLPGSAASRMNRATQQGEALLLRNGNPTAANNREIMLRRDQITNYLNSQPSPVADFVANRLAPAGAGGVLAYEGRVFPDQMDMNDVNLTPEQRQQARDNIFNAGGFALNALMGGVTGLSAQEAVDRLVPRKSPDVELATAVRDRLQRYRRR